ncbi:hypothetical protein [Actinomadura parmotrematis]|uniref:Lipoprotein n=1 Tax=Actinomadura parmotrematis TaxID=2864039 RepID=A0ABS7FMS6_9ACTN|nr:hypothetical protein [Actinomadura parmotrematis]MBW8481059.1 hypothetical protein [Actinomadura parmotrematis]
MRWFTPLGKVLALGAVGLSLGGAAGCGAGEDATAATAPAGAVPAAAARGAVLGPDGLGALRLGMSVRDAEGTGLIRVTGAEGGCTDFEPARRGAGGFASARYGVEYLGADAGVRTPQGVAIGSPRSAVARAYPRLTAAADDVAAAVPGNPRARYVFSFDGGAVSSIVLALATSACAA